ncbi:hypothetical protein L1987_42575 [Smallanthus sonchifolius]|uniref:Uncharacterized protein n=1 Tax=Smallanthus sonchifolius TaxID=185202 RepID=A0ACB9GKG9_9ASTR|nr:hypothetical protein L1987_42575 [Smallanthus sonchifolius]
MVHHSDLRDSSTLVPKEMSLILFLLLMAPERFYGIFYSGSMISFTTILWDDDRDGSLVVGRVCIRICHMSPINERVKVLVDNVMFPVEIKEYSHWSLAQVVDDASVSGAQGDGEEEVESFGDLMGQDGQSQSASASLVVPHRFVGRWFGKSQEGGLSPKGSFTSRRSEKKSQLVSPIRSGRKSLGKTRSFSLGNLNGFSMVDEVSKFIDLGKTLGFSMDGTKRDFEDMINGWVVS